MFLHLHTLQRPNITTHEHVFIPNIFLIDKISEKDFVLNQTCFNYN